MKVKILYGAPVYTMDEAGSRVEAVVFDTEIKFVGDKGAAMRLFPEGEVIEFRGGCILPGFIDSHLHLRDLSLLFKDLDLTQVYDRETLIQLVGEVASGKGENEWVFGGGVDFSILVQLTKKELDGVSPKNPVLLYSRDMHSALVNSAALDRAGIDRSRGDLIGGRIERGPDGSITGILKERAIDLVKKHLSYQEVTDGHRAIEGGINKLVREGITTFCDCSIHGTGSLMHALLELNSRGKMNMRAVVMFSDREASRLGAMGIRSQFGNESIRIGGCKLILDGSLSSLTGYMSRPYRGGKNRGILLMNERELYQVLERSYSDLIWVGVHAIGDKANEIALDAFEKLGTEKKVPNLLKRIEHAQTLRDVDIDRFPSIGVIPVVNPVHIPFDRKTALLFMDADARLQHRLGSLLAAGATLAIGSDAPVASVNPFHGIYPAVERKDFNDGQELRFFPHEAIQLTDAVYAYTMGGAKALGLAEEIGSIELGKYADLIHLSHDIFTRGVQSLKRVEVLHAFIGGRLIYQKI